MLVLFGNQCFRIHFSVTHFEIPLESEAMVKVDHAKRHLRDNDGGEVPLYHDIHHPLCYCEEFQQKVYTSE